MTLGSIKITLNCEQQLLLYKQFANIIITLEQRSKLNRVQTHRSSFVGGGLAKDWAPDD